jgi:acetyltransferase-like isoleucine patch superfamily enzyme
MNIGHLFKKINKSPFMNKNSRYSFYDIGDWTYGWPEILSWGEKKTIKIGKFCSIAPGVIILLGGEHNVNWVSAYPFNSFFKSAKGYTGHPRSKGDVIIGNDVWIGRGALILSGVTIGDGAVIGANSVVSRHVAPYSITAGNPAKHIRYRFNERSIKALEQIAWWNWPLSRIEEAFPLLMSPNIEEFIQKYESD